MVEIIDFLKNDILGLVILGVISSIIATLFYNSLKKLYRRAVIYRQRKKVDNMISKIITNYSDGYTAGYAEESSYRQIVLTGNYLIGIIIQVGVIIFSTLVFIASMILVGQPFSWVFVIIFSVVITLQYRRLTELKGFYKRFMEGVFGDEFYEKVKENAKKHIENIVKK